jgi:hypothetical protein
MVRRLPSIRSADESSPLESRPRLSQTLLVLIIFFQVVGWIGLVLVLKPEALLGSRVAERHVVVERDYGVPDPQEAQHVVVTSKTSMEIDGERIHYSPEDETDAIEYATNYIAVSRGSTVVIRRSIMVRAGPDKW